MSDYRNLDVANLLELLTKYTSQYTRLLTYGVFNGEDFLQCKQALAEIHQELKARTLHTSGKKVLAKSHTG